ncbi:MAG: hypothetical protein GY757_07885, partial [bacterium]|nr:hypothetical protein [bacterium]
GFHQIPETLPFDKSFTFNYQADFLDTYFMSKERLLNVLPHQMKLLSENEFVQKYDSYLPQKIESFEDFLGYAGITSDELKQKEFVTDDCFRVTALNEKLKKHFAKTHPPQARLNLTGKTETPLKVLLLDLSHYFGGETAKIYNVAEPPQGLMSLMSYLKENIKTPVKGKIAKAFIDFDSYEELETLVHNFKPDVIGIRTLTLYQKFFHKTAAKIRQWAPDSVVIAGGPYATSDYETILKDRNINLTVLGEGELTFLEVIERIVENGGKLPGEKVLKEIRGIAFIPPHMLLKDELTFDHMDTETTPGTDTNKETNAGKTGGTRGHRSPVGEKLAGIWAAVLEIETLQITPDGNFFELGGHSLNATRMVANIHKELQIKIPLTTVFKNQTLNELTEALEALTENKYTAITPVEKKKYYPLSAAQKRLYILQQMDLQSNTYNMSGTIPLPPVTLEGSVTTGESDVSTLAKLEETIGKLIQRHESLRTSFYMLNPEGPVTPNNQSPIPNNPPSPNNQSLITNNTYLPVQEVHANVAFKIEVYEANEREVPRQFFRSFDLTRAPLLRVGVVKRPGPQTGAAPFEPVMLVDMHHIISDGVSLEILGGEFLSLLAGETLSPLQLCYRDYAAWQSSSEQKQLIKKQEEYWVKTFYGELPVLDLPTDYPRPAIQSFEGNALQFTLEKQEIDTLKK